MSGQRERNATMDARLPGSERTTALLGRNADTGEAELYLTIENAIEDRVRAYMRLMRMKRVLEADRIKPRKT